ncbi:MAG: hypothetical protein R3C18_08385 [Planctomycetaceae bacterium]
MNHRGCQCAASGRPLWSVREQDRYCPVCGGQIRWLAPVGSCVRDSDRAQGPPEIWLYPTGTSNTSPWGMDFAFSVMLGYSGPQRRKDILDKGVPLSKQLSIEVSNAAQSDADVTVHDDPKYRTSLGIHLKGSCQGPIESYGQLKADLTVRGDFPEQEWCVFLCRTPELWCELRGEGVRRGQVPSKHDVSNWEFTERMRLRLTLSLKVDKAPLIIGEAGLKIEVDFYDELGSEHGNTCLQTLELQPDTPVLPGTAIEMEGEQQTSLYIDTHDMHIGHEAVIRVKLDVVGEPTPTVEHKLRCRMVESSGITVEPKQVSIPVIYVGEHRSNDPANPILNPEGCAGSECLQRWEMEPVIPMIEVRNGGRETVQLKAIFTGDPGLISVRLENSGKGAGTEFVELPPGKSCYLIVDINCASSNVLANQQQGLIVLENFERAEVAKLLISVDRIAERTDSPTPLFIDFGNANTYGCVTLPKSIGFSRRPTHDLRADGNFPSVQFFIEMVPNDLPRSKCLIGPHAVERDRIVQGPDRRSRVIHGLKYRLGSPEFSLKDTRLLCQDEVEGTAWLEIPQLLAMFMREMIRSAELLLRAWHIRRLVVSYPARWTPNQRRQYMSAMRQACELISQHSPLQRIELEEETLIDEANAAVLGFVYDAGTEFAPQITECLNKNDKQMTVAAVDLGGGSLDIAVITFTNVGASNRRPRYRSSYRWIGGDSQLGGNNLTVATLEWIRKYWSEELFHDSQAFSEVPEPNDYFADRTPDRASRFQSLWNVAEQVKVKTCIGHQWTEEEAESILADLASAARLNIPKKAEHKIRWPTLNDLLDWKIAKDQHNIGGYKFLERFRKRVKELAEVAVEKGIEVNFLILGGAASRTPGLADTLQALFTEATLVVDQNRLKAQVAEGLAAAWNVLRHGQDARPACAGDYTTTPLALWDAHHGIPCVFLDVCTPINSTDSLPLNLPEEPSLKPVEILIDFAQWSAESPDRWQLLLVRLLEDGGVEQAGRIDSAEGRYVNTTMSIPAPPQETWEDVYIRFDGAEDRLTLFIRCTEGIWETKLRPV